VTAGAAGVSAQTGDAAAIGRRPHPIAGGGFDPGARPGCDAGFAERAT